MALLGRMMGREVVVEWKEAAPPMRIFENEGSPLTVT